MAEKSTGYYASQPKKLPASEEVNIAALSRLFSNTTNSYKYIFFISILDILKRRRFDISQPIAFEELTVEMLANAWYPHTYFKLSFGSQDQITQSLDSLNLEIQEPVLRFTDTDKKLLRTAIESQDLEKIIQKLQRYVPFRLITPFLEQELQGTENKDKGDNLDRVVPRAAENRFNDYKPLYRFDSNQYSSCHSIIFHPSWAIYFEKHYTIIRGWAAWEWLKYMQRRNPSTPGLVHKLFAPSKRESLSKQSTYWKTVLNHIDFYCIYSGQKIEAEYFSLDHYLPWSFVAHDQLWNLVPTTPAINSSKSNNLPPAQVFEKFVTAQHLGLTTCYEQLSRNAWNRVAEVYINDLRINQDDLLDLEKLRNAYSDAMQPLVSLATNQGFKLWQSSYIA
jgi:HNH endonuclease